jgi:hypothetical protein
MVYAGVGVKAARFEYNIFEKADCINAPSSKRSLHFLTELGVETPSSTVNNLAYRFSYSWMPLKSLYRKTASFPMNHIYSEHGFFKFGTTEHSVKVGLVYKF